MGLDFPLDGKAMENTMKKIFSLALTTSLILMSWLTTGQCTEQTHHKFKANEIDALIGQWKYKLVTEDGTKIIGFFQVQPSTKNTLPVIGQAYYDKGSKVLITKNLRGVWSGSMQKSDLQQSYILTFTMRGNPFYTSNKKVELPYHGTIYFHQKNETLNGRFSDHDSREGIGGTITAYRHYL
jgi:hypothetical protein